MNLIKELKNNLDFCRNAHSNLSMPEIKWQHLKEDGLFTFTYNRLPIETFNVKLNNKGAQYSLTATISNNMIIDDSVVRSYLSHKQSKFANEDLLISSETQTGHILIKEEPNEVDKKPDHRLDKHTKEGTII